MRYSTKIIAHRGFSSRAPENTLTSFQMAMNSGVDYIELDIHKTKDNRIVVIHDDSVDRVASDGSKGKVAEMSYAELRKIEVGYNKKFGDRYQSEKIPTIEEVLVLCKGKMKVCIEIKEPGIEEQLLQIIHVLKMRNEVVIFSFDYPVLERIRQIDREIRIVFLVTKSSRRRIKMAAKLQAYGIGVSFRTTITRKYLKRVHLKKLQVWKWTINQEDKIRLHIEAGLDGLITDYPEKALEIRRSLL